MQLFPHRSTLCWKPRHRLRLELQLERSFPACLLAKKSKESNSKLMPRGRMVFYLMVAMQFLYNLVPDLPKFWLERDARLLVLWMLFVLALWTENEFEVLLILRQASWDSDWSRWTRDLFLLTIYSLLQFWKRIHPVTKPHLKEASVVREKYVRDQGMFGTICKSSDFVTCMFVSRYLSTYKFVANYILSRNEFSCHKVDLVTKFCPEINSSWRYI